MAESITLMPDFTHLRQTFERNAELHAQFIEQAMGTNTVTQNDVRGLVVSLSIAAESVDSQEAFEQFKTMLAGISRRFAKANDDYNTKDAPV